MKFQNILLGQKVKVVGGFAFKSEQFTDAGTPILRISNIIGDGTVDLSRDIVYYPSSHEARDFELAENDIVMAMSGATTGKVGRVEKNHIPCLLNQRVAKFVAKDDSILPDYLFWILRSPFYQRAVWSFASGCAQPNISSNQLEAIQIPISDKAVQERIASLLSQAESALEKRRQTLRLAEEFLKSAFWEMFGEPGANSKNFKTSPIKDLVKKVLNEDPKRYPAKSYSYADISSIDNQLKKITETKQILGSDAPIRARQLLQAQDVLVSTVRPNLNAVGVLPDGLSNPIGSTGLCVLRAHRELARPEYLFEICKTPFFIKSLVNVAKGASYPAVSDSDILRLSIPVPSLPKQQKFADLVQKVEKLKEKQKQSETELDHLFNSLMQRAFRGELYAA